MREIKFRAWHIEDKFMFIPRRIDFPHFMIGDTAKWEVWYQFEDEDDSTPEHFPLEDISFSGDELEIMQYTGLKDKNGKEICQGDCLKCTMEGEYQLRPYVVEDLRKFFEDTDTIDPYLRIQEHSFEIIGNVHENPELAEKRQEDES